MKGNVNPYSTYAIPVYGWIRYTLPNCLKTKDYFILFENSLPYIFIGIMIGLYPKMASECVLILIPVIIFEGFLYYKKWIGGLLIMPGANKMDKHQRLLSYLFAQMHMIAITTLTAYLMIILGVLLW